MKFLNHIMRQEKKIVNSHHETKSIRKLSGRWEQIGNNLEIDSAKLVRIFYVIAEKARKISAKSFDYLADIGNQSSATITAQKLGNVITFYA